MQDNPDALYKFKVVSEAYEVLSNPESKRQYDQQNGFNVIRYLTADASSVVPAHASYRLDALSFVAVCHQI